LSLEAAYLHARAPEDARLVVFSPRGLDAVRAALPQELAAAAEEIDFEILLAAEESSLEPVVRRALREDGLDSGARIAPALWHARGLALDLRQGLGWLVQHEPAADETGMSFLRSVARLTLALLQRGDFAPADSGGLLRFVPHWTPAALRCLAAIAELAPETLLTARFPRTDAPVYAVTPRNLVLSFVGHAVHANADRFAARRTAAERPPREFWRTRPAPLLHVLRPARELEEGVPWAIQLRFQPVAGVPLDWSLEELKERQSQLLFPDAIRTEAIEELAVQMENLARRLPALRRAMNMSDGRASLNRQELDQVLDHLPLLESEGFRIDLPGLDVLERLTAKVVIEEEPESRDELRPWFSFQWQLAVGGQPLSEREFETLIGSRHPLVELERGHVLLSPKDREALEEIRKRLGKPGQRVSFFEALRLKLGGATHLHGLALETMETSERLDRLVQALEQARSIDPRPQPAPFVGELRPYQNRGHAWLHYLVDQGFGACLADDMGLGKTIQAIALMLDWRTAPERRGPVLLVCPVSVLGNWRRELHRFAPNLRVTMHHGKARARDTAAFDAVMREHDVILTSYNLLQRDEELLAERAFEGVILDEAQNIKNPATRQSRVARRLNGRFRIALTGTPLENRPLDLWSIMDFLNEGLLGTRAKFLKTLEHPIVKQRSRSAASSLARLVRPFVLRRLKTDPEIISDLPEKSEQVVAASLTREQGVLYEGVVRDGLADVESAGEGLQRRGAILTTLLRLKQVCNHPAHYLGDGSSLPGRSGKLDLLTEMLEEALAEGDRCLIFTQFKEMGTLLRTHLEAQIGERVLFLHGGVPQKEREAMVAEFQGEGEGEQESPRLFVLSLKAGGTGLNLTMANRVFHYDRWWNPAVEDQATDRAFRIGQQRNVFVHKFVCAGTLEERIQSLLERKRMVADGLLGAGEGWLTEMSNEELRRLLVLDREEALA
jgi:SNF2 family DNA or RNA helicase